jgi:hypothetical protein
VNRIEYAIAYEELYNYEGKPRKKECYRATGACLIGSVAACYLLSAFFSLASWNRFFTAEILDF